MFKKKILFAIMLATVSVIGLGVSTGTAHAQGYCYWAVPHQGGDWVWQWTWWGWRQVLVPCQHPPVFICD